MLEFYDSLFRYWAIGLFILIGILCLREYGWRLAAIFAAMSSFGAAAYLFGSQPIHLNPFGWGNAFLAPLSMLAPIFIWLFSLSQFEDGFHLRKMHFFVICIYITAELTGCFKNNLFCYQASHLPLAIIRIAILFHMVFVAWQGRADDLLETRRRFRTLYIVLVTGFTAVVTVVETWFRGLAVYPEIYIIQAFAFMVLAMVLVLRLTKMHHGVILVGRQDPDGGRVKKQLPVDGAERHDLEQVTNAVIGEKLYLKSGLTIAVLAEHVGFPEHRLRRLINRHLGHRNFADFLNHYRISEAKDRLSDMENRNQQILVIAMDLGYGSLGPFNRAFKERTGLTPSEYRKKALAETE